jgi:four helix bundle protein
MTVTRAEDLLVYQKALRLAYEVSAILRRETLRKDFNLWEQLGASSDAVPSLISEGFGQGTDRHFALYLLRARGSSMETRTHLEVAHSRNYLTKAERYDLTARYVEVERMLGGLIAYLRRENRRDRR